MNLSQPKVNLSQPKESLLGRKNASWPMSQAKETMLVAPDAILYIVPDEAALQRVARAHDPPLNSATVANLRQLLQWTPKPAG